MKKQQQWTSLLFKVFSKTTTMDALRHRPFCTTTTTTTNTSLFAAEAANKLHVLNNKKKKLPLLIVPYDHKGGDGDGDGDGFNKKKERRLGSSVCDDTLGLVSFFDDDDDDDEVEKKKKKVVHKLYLPEIADRRICGSSEGWLITIHENAQVQLLNPITRVLVHLPHSTSFPEVVGKLNFEKENYRGLCYIVNEDISGLIYEQNDSSSNYQAFNGYDSHYFREDFFKKAVTSTTTTTDHANNNKFTLLPTVVMSIYGEARRLAFCRPSGNNDDEQKRWMGCLQGDRGFYDDVTFYKGNFYAVGCFGDVVVVKGLDGSSPFVETIIERGEDFYTYTNYLVESTSSSSSGGDGDLLKVMRRIEDKYKDERPYRTTRFRVMKLDFNGGGPASLVKVTNLGEDCALFIGYNHSFSFSASKIPGCKGNCIYFTDNNLSQFYKFGGHDMGVYNLEDGSVEELDYETTSSSQLFMPPPVWYVPN